MVIDIALVGKPEPGKLSYENLSDLTNSIVIEMERGGTRKTTILDYIRNVINEYFGTNLELDSTSSQREYIKNQLQSHSQGKFTEKYNTIVPNDQAPSR